MARLSEEDKNLKIKALKQTIKVLKQKSTPTKNLVTFTNVIEVANSSEYSKNFNKNISRASILQPRTKEFEKIRNKIKKCINNNKKSKNLQSNKSTKKIKNLQLQLDEVTIRIVELLDNEILLRKNISNLERENEMLKTQKDNYLNELNSLKKVSNEYRT